MYLFLFTTYFLDITSGVVWWITSNTIKIVYNGVVYMFSNEDIKEGNLNIENNYDTLNKKEMENLKKELKEIKELIVQKNKLNNN